jgi:hypothetical protein
MENSGPVAARVRRTPGYQGESWRRGRGAPWTVLVKFSCAISCFCFCCVISVFLRGPTTGHFINTFRTECKLVLASPTSRACSSPDKP